MCAKSRQFPDDREFDSSDIDMSDEALEALLAGHSAAVGDGAGEADEVSMLEPGTRVTGTVVDTRGGEVLLELDSKSHGVIEESEFAGDPDLPEVGSKLEAELVRYDAARGLAVLSVRGTRRQVFWEELRPGMVLEGVVTATNRGGLTLDIKGTRAFLPISQIERARVEDAAPYVGKKLRVEVTSVDRQEENLVVSRRVLLEREADELRNQALARLSEGEVLTGTVVRINEHGAFIDLGGVEGLLHASKIRTRRNELGGANDPAIGSRVEVEVQRLDLERGRVSLDFKRVAADSWHVSIEGYSAGDVVTGWIARIVPEGAVLAIEEGVEGLIPRSHILERSGQIQKGAILRARVTAIDTAARRIELEPLD